jgi:hypothetical protein
LPLSSPVNSVPSSSSCALRVTSFTSLWGSRWWWPHCQRECRRILPVCVTGGPRDPLSAAVHGSGCSGGVCVAFLTEWIFGFKENDFQNLWKGF